MSCTLSPETIAETIRFHGHMCPGLAIGIRAAELALREFGRSGDEEIVAVVETDMCGVDAVQYLLSCTFGKGNLIHLDYGKNAFSFFRRTDGKSMRILARPTLYGERGKALAELHRRMSSGEITAEEKQRMQALREEVLQGVMQGRLEDLFEVGPVRIALPEKARVLESHTCEACGEPAMESRTRLAAGRRLCVPCSSKIAGGGPSA